MKPPWQTGLRRTMLLLWALVSSIAIAQEQYPKPLVHTPADHPATHVLLVTVNGLHAIDLANWIAQHPSSTLTELSSRGVTYTNAHSLQPNAAAGLMAITTGGTPISTGIVAIRGYDHSLSPNGSNCRSKGAELVLDSPNADLPLDPRQGCKPVPIHSWLRVKTMFEVVHEKIGRTAWAGDNPSLAELLRGPSGAGLDESCVLATDEQRVNAVLHWIGGKDCDSVHQASVPALFGLSLTAVAKAQSTPGMGYLDALRTPSVGLQKAVASLDAYLKQITDQLKADHLYDSTWILVTAAFGQAPIDQRQRKLIPLARIRTTADRLFEGQVLALTGGDVAMIWLRDPTHAAEAAKAYSDHSSALGIQSILFGNALTLTLNSPAKDTRMPDILLQPQPGVLWTNEADSAIAGSGGTLDEDTHVALLVSGSQLTGRYDPTLVPTTQIAPLLLRALGMEKFDLKALHLEHSPALPGIF